MSFPPGTEMFQFPGFASRPYVFRPGYPKGVGFPIRTSADQRSLASPRGFSQRATSFIASWRQGIHRTPFSCSLTPSTARAQDQTAPGCRHPRAPDHCSVGTGTTHASANFTHFSDKPSNPIARPPQTGMTQPKGQTIHPPDPIHRLKEHAQPGQRPSQESRAREVRNRPTSEHAPQWRLADSNR
jgi:hypothetical protein